ncbi:MAG: hypothetical protein HYT80_10935 [Euryarchaeota archaeon]|nr:hypothetical protein [Euryarchaeota archaeon]
MRAIVWAFLGAALGLGALAGAAQAQAMPTVNLEVEIRAAPDDNGRLMPETEAAEFQVIVRPKFPPFPGVCTSEYRIILDVVGALGYQSVALSPSAFSGFGSMGYLYVQPEPVEHRAKMTVSVMRDAPAFKDEMYRVKATILFPSFTNGCTFNGGPSVTAAITMKNDFVPGITVDPQANAMDAEAGSFMMRVANIGNGPTRVQTEVFADEGPAFAALRAPAELRLESRASKGSNAFWTGDLMIDYALAQPGTHSFTAVLRAMYDGAAEDTRSEEHQVRFTVTSDTVADPGGGTARPQGSDGEVPELPGFAHLAALGALGATAIWRRRRAA